MEERAYEGEDEIEDIEDESRAERESEEEEEEEESDEEEDYVTIEQFVAREANGDLPPDRDPEGTRNIVNLVVSTIYIFS